MNRRPYREGGSIVRCAAACLLAYLLRPATAGADFITNLVVRGSNRTFIVHVPTTYDGSRAFPVLLMFHGLNSSAAAASSTYDWQTMACSNRFLVVFPESLSPPGKNIEILGSVIYSNYDGIGKRWDVAHIQGTNRMDSQDVDFAAAILDWMQATYNVRTSHVFTTGHSYGAFFSYYVAGGLQGRIKAFAEHSGGLMGYLSAIYWPLAVTSPPPSVPGLLLHSPADPTVAYSNSVLLRDQMTLRGQTNSLVTLPDALGHAWDKAHNQTQWDFFLSQTPVMDDDADGIPDSWEWRNGLDDTQDDSGADPDHDGATNLEEYRAGTDPQDGDSVFEATPEAAGEYLVHWVSVSGKTYSIFCAPNPASPFTSLVSTVEATPPRNTYTAAPPADASFYRLSIP